MCACVCVCRELGYWVGEMDRGDGAAALGLITLDALANHADIYMYAKHAKLQVKIIQSDSTSEHSRIIT